MGAGGEAAGLEVVPLRASFAAPSRTAWAKLARASAARSSACWRKRSRSAQASVRLGGGCRHRGGLRALLLALPRGRGWP